MSDQPGILFTAFEPSGDVLAARLIAALRQHEPDRPIYAMGGDAMAEAGAELIEQTTAHAAMLGDAVRQAVAHKRRLSRLGRWMRGQRLAMVVPTDSPAANWGVCSLARKHHPQARIVHLAAPQLWAWASWRIQKMRRLSDHVMCLLPFEKPWFEARDMPATFVGHPIFEDALQSAETSANDTATTGQAVRLALLPGSRAKEIERNWPTMLAAYRTLHERFENLHAVAAVRDATSRQWVEQASTRNVSSTTAMLPEIRVGQTPQVIDESQVVLTVSGTATLQVLAHGRPMVALYNTSPLTWHAIGRWVIATRTFTLPNLISESMGLGRAIPELVPHFGAVPPVVEAVSQLLEDERARQAQMEKFAQIRAVFEQVQFSETACAVVRRMLP